MKEFDRYIFEFKTIKVKTLMMGLPLYQILASNSGAGDEARTRDPLLDKPFRRCLKGKSIACLPPLIQAPGSVEYLPDLLPTHAVDAGLAIAGSPIS